MQKSAQSSAARSAKVPRKGLTTKSDMNVNKDPSATPKLHQLQEVHQTTIMEENETLRGSIENRIGQSKIAQGARSGQKGYKNIGVDGLKKSTHSVTRSKKTEGLSSATGTKMSLRTKSSVGGP